MGNNPGIEKMKAWEEKDMKSAPKWYCRQEYASWSDFLKHRTASIITYRMCMERRGLASATMDKVLRYVIAVFYYTRIPNVFRTIATGHEHSLALDERNKLYTFGSNATGQLGHGDTLYRSTPERVYVLGHIPIVSVAAG